MFDRVVPRPQSWKASGEACQISSLTQGRVIGLAPDALPWLAEDLPGTKFEASPGNGFAAVLGTDDDAPDAPADLGPEGYVLDVGANSATVVANDAAGLWYGLQSLAQAAALSNGAVPAGELRDYPAIRWRGVHVDLKGYQFHFERLLEVCRLLARHRVNAILLEVEDKFAYAGAPEVGVPGAYTAAQFRRLGEVCAAVGIQVIPKLQCLGHVDYLLKHERYRHLRENDHPFQYCPRNEEGMELWRGMARELMDCFPGHAHFHIGGDETGNLGECPVCQPFRKAESYSHRVGQCLEYVRQEGRRPILWEDILRNLHGNLNEAEVEQTWELGRDAILMYWAYGYGGRDNTFPLLPRYLEHGMQVWGASGYSGCGPSWIQNVPPLAERALNIAAWTKAAIEHGLEGVTATGWTRIASADPPAEPLEACWFAILYAADSMWRGEERPLPEFCRDASHSLFGADVLLGPYLASTDPADLPADNEAPSARREAERLALLRAAAGVAAHDKARREFQETMQMYHGRLGPDLPDYRRRLFDNRLGAFRDSLERRRDALRQGLEAFYEQATVADIIVSRFGRDEQLVREAEQALG